MSNPSLFIESQVPSYYLDDYPKFVAFMKAYYDWLYRIGGFTADEYSYLIKEQLWLQTDIEKYVLQGGLQYAGTSTQDEVLVEMSNALQGEAYIDRLIPQFFLERTFDLFQDSEEEIFLTAEGSSFESPYIDHDIVNMWFYKLGFPTIAHHNLHGTYDQFSLIRALKYIYAIKGTAKSIQLFFNIFFNETVTVSYTKSDIAIIDGNWIPDEFGVIRDDHYYNEYSYVVTVNNDPDTYTTVINNVYNHLIHPAGFNMFLEQV